MKKAVVLLSGGLDSSTVLFHALKKGYDCRCLIFDYGQRHKREIRSAAGVARAAKCPYRTIKITLPWKTSSLLDKNIKIPLKLKKSGLPTTYVPGRNTIFISFALSFAEAIKAETVFIGANAVDYSGYPDCRPGYYKALNKVLGELGTGVRIETPLIKKTKSDIVKMAGKLKVPLNLTWSCYKGGKKPCGECDSCRFRAKGFREAGLQDPSLK
jgi:7-cyano-7-deazaguanine synthase